MGKIVAVGGGGFEATLPINREIVRLSGKKNPRILFIPTASSDNKEYIAAFSGHFGNVLKANIETLLLYSQKYSSLGITKKVLSADIIYVGGGNTFKMMRMWRKRGVDTLLRRAFDKGTVLSGISAGANCWFRFGHSDSRSYSSPNKWEYIKVTGLSFFPVFLCPHFSGEKRERSFLQMVKKQTEVGIALDDCTALEIVGADWRILKSKEGAKAYKIFRRENKTNSEELMNTDFEDLSLLEK